MIPLKDRVIVKPEYSDESKSDGGLHLPDHDQYRVVGRVVSVGHVSEIAPDDVVIFSPLAGSRLDHDGESYLVLREDDILAVWE